MIPSVQVLLESEELVIWRTFCFAPLITSTPMEYRFSSLDKVFFLRLLLDFLVGNKFICSGGAIPDVRVGAGVLRVEVHRSPDLCRQVEGLEKTEARRRE